MAKTENKKVVKDKNPEEDNPKNKDIIKKENVKPLPKVNEEKKDEKKLPNAKKEKVKVEKNEKIKEEVAKENDEKVLEEIKKDDTVSLKEIREALENKVSNIQKRNILKENIINILIAIVIVLYLIIVFMGSKNMSIELLETDLKVFSISFAIIGLIILELAYKKDNSKIAITGAEILIFGAINLCMMYVVKLYPTNLLNTVTYISIGVGCYYLIKVLIQSLKNVKKYKEDNNDIKEIIKK